MAQITFFSQLSEVQLNDWTVQESNFLETHYPSNDYSECLTLNSYEFVAILNDYCDRLSEDATFFDNDPSRQYLENCNQKFPPENAILDSKIDTLEARTTRLKGQITGANTRLSDAPQSSFNNKLAENFVATKPLSNPNQWKNFTQRISVENIDADERKWGFPTNRDSNSDFKWNGFLNKETITKTNQKGDIQVLSLEVILAFQNPLIQGDLGKILVNIKLI